ncbi:MAG: hypothetical protein QGG36_25365 [Pirellulaceae bacterium]|nr:hypothetical protein [Pirellulaceae bacterium]
MPTRVDDLLNSLGPVRPFRPYWRLSNAADAVNVYFSNERDYSQRLTDRVTVFRSIETDEIVGCRIKGVAEIIK